MTYNIFNKIWPEGHLIRIIGIECTGSKCVNGKLHTIGQLIGRDACACNDSHLQETYAAKVIKIQEKRDEAIRLKTEQRKADRLISLKAAADSHIEDIVAFQEYLASQEDPITWIYQKQ